MVAKTFTMTIVVNRHGVKDRRVRGGGTTLKVNSLYKMPATKGAGVKIFSTFILTRRVHQMVTFPFEGYKKNVTGNIVQLLKTCLLLRIGVLLHPLPAVDHSPSPFSSSEVILYFFRNFFLMTMTMTLLSQAKLVFPL